jgi:hypothetical protein
LVLKIRKKGTGYFFVQGKATGGNKRAVKTNPVLIVGPSWYRRADVPCWCMRFSKSVVIPTYRFPLFSMRYIHHSPMGILTEKFSQGEEISDL